MANQNVGMAKKDPKSSEQYRKPSRMVRIRERLAKAGDSLAQKLDKDLTEIVNDALREKLEREGFWPDQPDDKKK